MWEVDELSSINKLRSIIKNRFGKSLEINRLTPLNQNEDISEYFFKNSDLVIPLFQEEVFLGTAAVKAAKDIDESQISTISTLVKMTLIPTLYSKFQILKENNLRELENVISETSMISLDSKSIDDFGLKMDSAFSPVSPAELKDISDSKIISKVIHLNGINEIVLKVAHQIHEMNQNFAFVPFKDLNINFEDLNSITKLGSITIFVKDVLELSIAQQKAIADFQKSKIDNSQPLIIIGSALDLTELANHPSIASELLITLDALTFEVNKAPLSYQKLKEVVEILFFQGE